MGTLSVGHKKSNTVKQTQLIGCQETNQVANISTVALSKLARAFSIFAIRQCSETP